MKQKKYLKKQVRVFIAIVTLILSTFILVPQYSEFVHAATRPKLNKQSVRLIKGQTTKLKLKGAEGKVKWKSNKKAVATVSKKGIVKARKKGNAQITANYAGKTYKCKVWVETPRLSKTSLALEAGKTENLTLYKTKQKVTWSSKNPEVADVNSKGNVTAKTAGMTTITAKISKKQYTCVVTVSNSQSDIQPETQPQPEQSEKIPTEETPQQPEEMQPQQPEQIVPQPGIIADVELDVFNGSITTEDSSIDIGIKNNTDEKIMVCEGYALERRIDGQWIEIPMETAIDEEELRGYVDPGKHVYFMEPLYKMAEADLLECGEYRVTKAVKVDNQSRRLRAEFTCEKGILMVSMTATGSNRIPTTQTSFEVEIKNCSNMDINTHVPFKLEKYVESEWVEWDLDWMYADYLPSMGPQEVLTYEVELTPAYEISKTCEPGKYRVRTEFYAKNQSMIGYVYFEIVE